MEAPLKDKGVKLDAGKLRFDLIPLLAQLEFVHVLTFGVKKYGANNWWKVIGWRWRYVGAGLRHVFAYMAGKFTGETYDKETGLHHLAHALCCFYFVLDNELVLRAQAESGNVNWRVVPDGDAVPPEHAAPTSSLDKLEQSLLDQARQHRSHQFEPEDQPHGVIQLPKCKVCGFLKYERPDLHQ